jgi:hypothetical protein
MKKSNIPSLLSRILPILGLLGLSVGLHGETTLTLGNSTGSTGDEKTVSLYITSDQGALAAQFDLYYDPAVVTLGTMEDGTALQDHETDVEETSDGVMRVTILSNTNAAFNEGSLLDIQLSYLQDVAEGQSALTLQNVLLIDNQVGVLEYSELVPVGTPVIGGISATVAGNAVTFQATVDSGTGLSYLWDLGDGTIASSASVTHTFSATGTYMVTLGVSNLISTSTATASVTVGKGGATVVLSNLEQTANGLPRTVTVTTDPEGLPSTVTYNGSTHAPSEPGSYTVEVTVTGDDYEGTATGVLVIKGWLDALSDDTEDLGGGWKRLDWFGYLQQGSTSWVYHSDHGWIFPVSGGEDSLWMYWPEGDWVWTGKGVYPHLFRTGREGAEGSWLYYYQGTQSPTHLFDYGTDEWTTRNP